MKEKRYALVGYDLETGTFGNYCRLQTLDHRKTTSCGKIDTVFRWYQEEYRFAQNNIFLGQEGENRTIAKSPEYHGKSVLFISGLNIDISPREGQVFPLTKCVPWAACIQNTDGSSRTLEQPELYKLLMRQSTDYPNQIDLEAANQQMIDARKIKIAP